MTNKETINRNIELTFDFVKQIIDHPSIAEQLPDHCEKEFIEKDYPSKNHTNIDNKYLVKVKNTFEPVNKICA